MSRTYVTTGEARTMRALYADGHSVDMVARFTGRSNSAVEASVKTRSLSEANRLRFKRGRAGLAPVARMHYERGLSLTEVACRLGIHRATARRMIVEAGGEMRPRGRGIARNRPNHPNPSNR